MKFHPLPVLWAFLGSLVWLMPNHYPPWANFHADAWMAFISLTMAIPIVLRSQSVLRVPIPALVAAVLALMPWIQLSFGLLSFRGQAWLSSGYLLGLLLSIVCGAAWEKKIGAKFVDYIFLSISIASIASVGLVIGSWAEVIPNGVNDYISMGYSGGRHYANIGQPNLLATFLLWGVLGAFWAYARSYIGFKVGLLLCLYLVVGVVLTKSRTGYVAGAILVILIISNKKFVGKGLKLISILMVTFYYLVPYVAGYIETNFFQYSSPTEYIRSSASGDIRLTAWRMFVDAALEQPWFGYGWTEASSAQMRVADSFPNLAGVFGHTHNIVLDLVIWVGIPVAITVLCVMMWWAWSSFRRLRSQEDLIVYLGLVVFGVHSLLEAPHQYASFLIPAGLFIGITSARVNDSQVVVRGYSISLLWVGACFWLISTVYDYLKIEASYNVLRYERAGLVYTKAGVDKIPDVYFLNQFKYFIEMARNRPNEDMSDDQLAMQEKVTRAFPSGGALFELSLAYALNGRSEQSEFWLKRICPMTSSNECIFFKMKWDQIRNQNAAVYNVRWPE